MQSLTPLRSLVVAMCACVALLSGSPSLSQHVHVGYGGGWHGGGWHGGYGWRGGYYGGWHGGYYGGWHGYYGGWGWRYPYYGWGWYGGYYPWAWAGYGWPYYYPYYGWAGAPYYYGSNTYYVGSHPDAADQGGYSSGPAAQPTVTPQNGQSQELQGKDTFECHRWAVGQTGFDPTRGTPGNRSDYFRAQAACLGARGYTVN